MRKRNLMLGGAAFLLALPALPQLALAQDNTVRKPIEYPQTGPGVQVGQGWNSQTATPTPAVCITNFQVVPSQGGSQTIRAQMTTVTDQTTMSNALEIGADVQVKSVAGYEAGVKTNFTKNQKTDNNFVSVAQLVQVDNGSQYAAPVPPTHAAAVANALRSLPPGQQNSAEVARRLNVPHQDIQKAHAPFFEIVRHARTPAERNHAQALALAYIHHAHLTNTPLASAPKPTSLKSPFPPPVRAPLQAAKGGNLKDAVPPTSISIADYYASLTPDDFLKQCGDSYITSINQGGELVISYTFMTHSVEEQEALSVAVSGSASYAGVNVSANADFQQQAKSFSSSNRLRIDSAIIGGSGLQAPTDLDGVNALVSSFAGKIAQTPHNYSYTVGSYVGLPGAPNRGMTPVTNFEKLAWEFGKTSSLIQTVTPILADINAQSSGQNGVYLLTRWNGSLSTLQQLQGALQQRLGNLKLQAQQCLAAGDKNAQVCIPADILDDLGPRVDFPLPIQPGRATDMINAVLADAKTGYPGLVFQYWIDRVNQQRCLLQPDPTYCALEANLTKYRSAITGKAQPAFTLQLDGQNNRCWAGLNDYGRMYLQPCPNNGAQVAANITFTALPTRDGIKLQTTVQGVGPQCVTALTDAPGSRWVAVHNCGDPNQEWAFTPSPDGRTFQIASINAPAFSGMCIAVSIEGNSTGIVDCASPAATRFVFGQTLAAK